MFASTAQVAARIKTPGCGSHEAKDSAGYLATLQSVPEYVIHKRSFSPTGTKAYSPRACIDYSQRWTWQMPRLWSSNVQAGARLRILPWAKLPKRCKRVAAVDRQEVQIGGHHTRSNLICLIVSSVYLHWRGCQSGHWIQPLARRD